MLQPTIYLIPRWAGTIHSDWYDWLVLEIKNKYKIEIQRLEVPDWNKTSIEESVQFLNENIKELNENTYFIGHSVGCQAILRFLDKKLETSRELKVGGFLFIAAWFEVDIPWVSLKPWLKTENLNFSFIAQAAQYKKIIISDNDPFTSDFKQNKERWKTKLSADVVIYSNQLHFNKFIEPNVLKEVEKMILRSGNHYHRIVQNQIN